MSIVNGWLHYTNRSNHSSDPKYNSSCDLSYLNASVEDLGQGFKRYTWKHGVQIKSHERIDFRLEVQQSEKVLSAGYLTSSTENIDSEVYLWLLVKE